MPMSEYEMSLVIAARKGRKKPLNTLREIFHDELAALTERELGSRENAEKIIRSAFKNARDEILDLRNPADFEQMIFFLTREECRRYRTGKSPDSRQEFSVPAQAPFMDPQPMMPDRETREPFPQDEVQQQAETGTGAVEPVDAPAAGQAGGVGMLVCIKGRDVGVNFSLKPGVNHVGVSGNSDVRISDDTVTADFECDVVYDMRRETFSLIPGRFASKLFLNGNYVNSPVFLQPQDVIGLGETAFLLVVSSNAVSP